MTDPPRADLSRRARDVLDRNRRGAWTCPARAIYPHQWLWDSCFVAIGLARTDPNRAVGELRALLRGQWANGMVPHMIFAEGTRDAGSRRIWQSSTHPEAPHDVETSCITQPPLLAIATSYVSRALPVDDRLSFLAEVFPKLLGYHRWLYIERDLERRGLVTLIHPWECGLDTTPPWMSVLARMPTPWWLRLALRWRLARIMRFLRRDTRYVPAPERASDDDGLRMLVLARRARRYGFELRRMPSESVRIEDVAFNALLAVANRSLSEIARDLDRTIDEELDERFRRTEAAIEQLWDAETGRYCSRDVRTGELLTAPTVATFLPLWAGVAKPRAARLVALLREPGSWPRFPVPSVPTDDPQFDAARYWKGPTWVNMSWMVIEGLQRGGDTELAEELRRRTLELVDQSGFAEYFSPVTGAGFGADEFSWTAALALDLIASADASASTGR